MPNGLYRHTAFVRGPHNPRYTSVLCCERADSNCDPSLTVMIPTSLHYDQSEATGKPSFESQGYNFILDGKTSCVNPPVAISSPLNK